MASFIRKRLVSPLRQFLAQGVSPQRLAWAVSLGVVLATVPVFGLSTLLCLLAISLFRLNPAAVLLVNQLAYPLQFILYLPLIRAGEWLFRQPPLPFNLSQIADFVMNDTLRALGVLGWSTFFALLVWLVFASIGTMLLYLIFRELFKRMLKAKQSVQD
ncbi:DUF2062 domain-containing protein [Cytophagales bacterium LB-30]|uniref:DUF2062 domain-containing protein n=1 Tax=Shiella aurantiaca TaxID=3058365 RepID=A0ABT8F6J7_9BACT|nr:DUF2062 domain-containing protein [Shiella aurantiaca]MDN4165851.1 DUF2062 domain-containing protein [Shiella aurantiaca]